MCTHACMSPVLSCLCLCFPHSLVIYFPVRMPSETRRGVVGCSLQEMLPTGDETVAGAAREGSGARNHEGMPPDPRPPAGPQPLSKGSGLPWSPENSDWLSCFCKSGLEALKHFSGGPTSKLTRPVKNIPGEKEN